MAKLLVVLLFLVGNVMYLAGYLNLKSATILNFDQETAMTSSYAIENFTIGLILVNILMLIFVLSQRQYWKKK